MLIIGIHVETAELAERKTPVRPHRKNVTGIVGKVCTVGIGGPVVDVPSVAYAIQGEIGIGIAEVIDGAVGTVVEAEAYSFARAENVVLGDAGIEDNALHLGVTHACHQISRGFLSYRVVYVNLIGCARNGGCFHVHILKITKPRKPCF